ncbi:biotin carboxylase [Corynebacterium pollutisoli]|uniref:biotin carboxylase n=1 Tax=Corynebacterium pollutisoli TaxID=1610489 RepID=A0A1X7K1N4_9CORY|nr:biotin carboxylase N-terminal domain-containing protein [Corynebacterium pollutisoli]SMG34426.1 biotin carboxylase [Corynebacterium pollutisoli]
MSHRIFIANRGEIALRILEACELLGIDTVLGVSSADTDTLAAKRAGRTIVIGGPRPGDSYLNIDAVLQAATATGCTAVHPGYGFLSENPEFARKCADNGLIFIGPSPEALESLGDKLTARRLAESVDVPVSAGGTASTSEELHALAAHIGYPVLIKASFGGGGRGMKLVHNDADLDHAWELAAAEAAASFGNGEVFLERFVTDAKHVEVQILGDRHGNRIHLGERECSVQYRYQKVIEEAPCAALPEKTRSLLHDSALRIAEALDYVGLGTVEFLYDVSRDELAFLEVNPRVQVEHPVTEAVTGVDLVRQQILAALGTEIEFSQSDIELTGHAIECRITAQDPDRGLEPTPGRVTRWVPVVSGDSRLDSHIYEGYLFPPYYDALMAKQIVWGTDRDEAIDRMSHVLGNFVVEGVTTSIPLLLDILATDAYRQNTVTTHWLTNTLEEIRS